MSPSVTSPLPLDESPRPPFPSHCLPDWLRTYVEAVSVQTQTPVDLPSMLALATIATAVAKRVVVRAYDGWSEPVNVFVLVALPPASRKSSVFSAMVAPIEAFEAELLALYAPAAAVAESQRKIAEGDLARAQQAVVKAAPDERAGLAEVADRLARELAEMKPDAEPRLFVDDVSPERLATLLALHDGRIAALAPEGDLLEIVGGRYSSGTPNMGVYLRGHAGEDLRVDRVGRPSELVRKSALTIALCAQPEVIAGLADKPGFRGRGLLARYLFSLPPSTVGRRAINPPPVPEAVRTTYHRHLTALLQLPAEYDHHGDPTSRVIDLSPGARDALIRFDTDLEGRLGELGDLGPISDWAGKLVGAVVRVAGLLHMAEHADDTAPWRVPITVETMDAAIEIGHYLTAHAQAAFNLMGADPVVEDARYVLRWIASKGMTVVTKREIHQGTKGRLKRVEALDLALAVLVAHGYLVERSVDRMAGPGRSPSPIYDVNSLSPSH